MIFKISIFFILQVFLSNSIMAEGAPIDTTGKIYANFVSITLDSSQIEHLQKNRYLKLTIEQQKRLYYLDLPKYIDIIDPFNSVCVCGQIYGMWYAPNKVAFVIEDTTKVYKHDSMDLFFDVYDKGYDTTYQENIIFIGSKGQLFYKGLLIGIKDIPKISESFNKDMSYIRVFLPPSFNTNYSLIILETRRLLSQAIPSDFKIAWD